MNALTPEAVKQITDRLIYGFPVSDRREAITFVSAPQPQTQTDQKLALGIQQRLTTGVLIDLLRREPDPIINWKGVSSGNRNFELAEAEVEILNSRLKSSLLIVCLIDGDYSILSPYLSRIPTVRFDALIVPQPLKEQVQSIMAGLVPKIFPRSLFIHATDSTQKVNIQPIGNLLEAPDYTTPLVDLMRENGALSKGVVVCGVKLPNQDDLQLAAVSGSKYIIWSRAIDERKEGLLHLLENSDWTNGQRESVTRILLGLSRIKFELEQPNPDTRKILTVCSRLEEDVKDVIVGQKLSAQPVAGILQTLQAITNPHQK